ncbi:DnaJ domain-containing protein [Williamsoniiplasma lucivorax]|uniref:DnaJ domain-containing protein n=1 Tax=Williamsoniiplasma lucivorax TaxID=209274 RepID=UPI001FD36129|nr:DnaJ domain-containing protein [Williamsoniiplasma lucivorax]
MTKSYLILGIDPKATNEEFKNEYLKLIEKYQPNTIQNKEELLKMSEIIDAYVVIKEFRKMD